MTCERLVQALEADAAFQAEAPRWVLVRQSLRMGGKPKLRAQLKVSAGKAYLLFLDPSGAERERLLNPPGSELAEKSEIERTARHVGTRMQGLRATPRKGLRGDALVRGLLRDSDKGVRYDAARVLLQYDKKDVVALIPDLIRALDDTKGAAAAATYALAHVGAEARAAIPALLAVMERGENPVALRQSAAIALGRIDVEGLSLSALRDQLRGGQYMVIGAALALRYMGKRSTAAVPDLLEAWAATKEDVVKTYLARALGSIGAGAAEAIPVLTEEAENGKGKAAAAAKVALKYIRVSEKPVRKR